MLRLSSDYMNRQELMDYLSINENALNRLLRQPGGKFPKPSRALGPNSPRWRRSEIDKFMNPPENVLAESVPSSQPEAHDVPNVESYTARIFG